MNEDDDLSPGARWARFEKRFAEGATEVQVQDMQYAFYLGMAEATHACLYLLTKVGKGEEGALSTLSAYREELVRFFGEAKVELSETACAGEQWSAQLP